MMIFILSSCLKPDCDYWYPIRKDKECLIIVKNMPDKKNGQVFTVEGKYLTNNKDTIYETEDRWFCTLTDYISEGDTIIKHKGQLIFNIHKKDTIYNFNWECDGKKYK